ncbi:cytochrome c [Marivita sp. XM-24bin2]|uniref:c-type cytochrome n=1 Tax=Marivita sp. XM-24bin2 TaxID=2133951 RepID=UPI000D7A6859|nr:cytochrome c [Marivita sp. XM-24bin2]PWL34862.1 MAG: cytochrome C [Marivita sp. XM-24bin2]
MTRFAAVLTVGALSLATFAAAHTGVKNPAVMARMDGMKATQDGVKVPGAMVKGERSFDAEAARAAAAQIAAEAARTPDLFEAQETDPNSEALPTIWENFADFTAKSNNLETVALALSTSLETEDQLRAGLGQIGAACKACHEVYRE